MIQRHSTTHGQHSAFCGCIGYAIACSHQAEHRGDIDDGTAPSGAHVRQYGTAELPHAAYIDIETLLPFLCRMGFSGARQQHSRIVHENMYLPELVSSGFHQGLDIVRISSICAGHHAVRANLPGNPIQLLPGASGNHHFCAFTRKSDSNTSADSAPATGNECDFASESHLTCL